jgi:phosphatidylglycerophosphatase C
MQFLFAFPFFKKIPWEKPLQQEKCMKKKTIAVFDFDGTITTTDSLLLFLSSEFGWHKVLLKSVLLLPLFISYFFKKTGRKEVKEALLKTFFEKLPFEEFQRKCEHYAQTSLPKIVRSKALEKISWHLEQKHTLILVSASIENYLAPWAYKKGFSYVLATVIETDEKMQVTGKILGENCRGYEKVRRLTALFPQREVIEVYAYGDSDGDKELLEFADHAHYRPFNS